MFRDHPQLLRFGFFFLNLIIILILYDRVEEPLPFFAFAMAVVLFAYSFKRALFQFLRF